MTVDPARLLSRFFDAEVSGLAPWVRDHLHVLAPAIEMHSLEPVRTESPVGPFRLDLLADGTRPDGVQVPVAVEVQLGAADHDHLGKLVTYLAHQGRGVGVWVVDRAAHPHLTAVDFLNRATGDDLVWWLVSYAHDDEVGPTADTTRVEVLAGPGVPLPPRPVRHAPVGAVRSHPTRTEFLQDVLVAVAQPSMQMGWRNPRITNKGYAITWALPARSPLARTTVKLRCHPDQIVLHLLVQSGDAPTNRAVVRGIREAHSLALDAELPDDAVVHWHQAHKSADSLQIVVPGVSWEGLPEASPQVVLQILAVLLAIVADPAGRHSQ